jgi:chromosome segregation ATPase
MFHSHSRPLCFNLKAQALARERNAWRAEREKLENSCHALTSDLRYLQTRYEDERSAASERDAAAATGREKLKKQLAQVKKELTETSGGTLADATKLKILDRKVEELTSENSALGSRLDELHASSGAALTSSQASHEREVGVLRHELETLRLAQATRAQEARNAAAVAATNSDVSAHQVARLQGEVGEARAERDGALAALSKRAGSIDELQSLRKENEALRRKLDASAASLQATTAERDALLDASQQWGALFKTTGGAAGPGAATTAGNKTRAAAGNDGYVTALQVYSEMEALRNNELKLTKELGASESSRRDLQGRVDEASREVTELKATQGKERRRLETSETEARTLKSLMAVKDQALQRRQELLESYETNEAKPGRRSDDQRLEKEKLMEAELATAKGALKELEQAALKDNARLERQLEKVERELAAHYTAMVRGEGEAPQATRILHMKDNPSAQAARERRAKELERFDNLERENCELKAKMNEVASSSSSSFCRSSSSVQDTEGCGSGGGGSSGGDGLAAASVMTTPSKEPTGEIVNLRLKEMFRKNVEQLKTAVMSLFGFELIFSPGSNGNYNVRATLFLFFFFTFCLQVS